MHLGYIRLPVPTDEPFCAFLRGTGRGPALSGLSVLETIFVQVWRCCSSFDNPKVVRFRANPFDDCVHLQRQSKRMKDSREESCPGVCAVSAPDVLGFSAARASHPNLLSVLAESAMLTGLRRWQ